MMKSQELLDEICSVLGREPGSLCEDDTPKSVIEWDSLGHLSIISVLHEKLHLTGEETGLKEFQSIGELVDRLKALDLIQD